ncbi:MAG: BolA/IbaG family iron-sulfur metabolism protein [Buchnera aphidicola (Kaburagia rhusicola rhusicola)]
MITEKIKHLLIQSLSLHQVKVTGNNNYIEIIAIDDVFHNKSEVEKQKIIYSKLMNYIIDKTIHSISIKTYSLKEWKKIKNNP